MSLYNIKLYVNVVRTVLDLPGDARYVLHPGFNIFKDFGGITFLCVKKIVYDARLYQYNFFKEAYNIIFTLTS